MAQTEPSIVDLLKQAIRDAQDLVRGEIALAKAELRQEGRRLGAAIAMLAGAAVLAVVAVILLMTTIALAASNLFGWAPWAGFALATGLTLLATGVLAMLGRSRVAAGRHMPRTMETMKENSEWIRARTS